MARHPVPGGRHRRVDARRRRLEAKVSRQVEAAVKEADVVLFVVDASVGLTDDDQTIANWIRRTKTEVIVVANKSDNERRETEMWEFMSLGLGEPVPVSALHGRRAGDLLDIVLDRFPEERAPIGPSTRTTLAPTDDRRRAGRGSGAAAGRDRRSAQRRQEHAVQPAGRRRPGGRPRPRRHDPRLDRHARRHRRRPDRVRRHRRHAPQGQDRRLRRVLLVRAGAAGDRRRRHRAAVIDATVGVTAQDQRLAERVDAAGCPTVLVLNKWDLVGTEERLEVQGEVTRMLGFVGDAPC